MTITALPVVVPLVAAAILVAARRGTPRVVHDLGAIGVAAAVVTMCGLLLARAMRAPFAYWMGGWRPRHGVAIGIAFSIDPLGAGMATFCAALVLAALIYAWRYFDSVDGLFHVLMLLFLAAMSGFCLTGDLFDLIVFFELMGAVAYALTAYKIEERGPLQGAINFAVSNSIAAYAMFLGVGMLYARTGALNMAQIGAALDGHRADPLVIVAMVLLIAGFLTKAAAIPFHFWLADAHAVAPTPVCVLFSGAMVELGLYAVARLYWTMFAGAVLPHEAQFRGLLLAFGVLTAVGGACMCVAQRHIKRLLAFSTISHVGLMLCGFALLSARGLAGVATYVIGHGFAKAALFMLAGVLLHRFGTVDEFELRGRGREIRLVGVLFAAGGLLLAACPLTTPFFGKSLLDDAAITRGVDWLPPVMLGCGALTGGAVLRVAGRVFAGWGADEAEAAPGSRQGAEEGDEETTGRDRTPWPMIAVPAGLLLLSVGVGLIPGVVPAIERVAAQFTDHAAYAQWVLHRGAHLPRPAASHVNLGDYLYCAGSTLGAVVVAVAGLRRVPSSLRVPRVVVDVLNAVRGLHSGHIGDYVTWWTAGVAVLGASALVLLR